MIQRRHTALFARGVAMVVFGLVCSGRFTVHAQEALSPMGQGEANINVRSDVTMAVEGARSTPNHRLQQIAEAATDQLGELRKCYRELSAKRPTAAGGVAMRLTFASGTAPPTLELKPKEGADPEVAQCVKRTFARAAWRKVERPSSAVLTFEFGNSRAKGEQAMIERRQAADQLEVRPRDRGGYEAGWASPDGKVAFVVANPAGREGIEPVVRKLREAFASFADCRRRSEQGGRSPVGALDVRLELKPRARGSSKVVSSTIAHPRAIPCVERVLSGLHLEGAEAAVSLELQVTFGAVNTTAP